MSRPSDLTVTDVFCGAGGNTIGAKRAGMRVRVALNHWERAIDTYAANNREVDVIERVDVSLCDPRRYPSTDIGIFSPECTTHSPAGGNKHKRPSWHPDLFPLKALDPATVRSRVTMLDVVRFAEYHRYPIVIVENVVEATRWELFPDWLQMMDHLGYAHRIVSLNSMFFHPTPQSRDRIYIVFWQRGNRAPDLEYRPAAPCVKCGTTRAVQVWKNGRTIGKYKRQYTYACPRCAREVTPFYYAALNAIDFSLAAERIGDRRTALRPRTMQRIGYGLGKYGRRVLVIRDNMTSGVDCRVVAAEDSAHFAQAASHWPMDGVCAPSPFMVSLQGNGRARDLADALPTQLAVCPHDAIVQPAALVGALPFLVTAGSNESMASGVDPAPTQTATERLALVVPLRTNGTAKPTSEPLPTVAAGGQHHMLVHGFLAMRRVGNHSVPLDGTVPTVTAGGEAQHLLVTGAAQLSMRDADAMRVAGLDRELMTQGCAPQQALIGRSPFLLPYYGQSQASPVDEAVPTVTTVDRCALVDAGEQPLRVEDCYFRMLQPHEVGAAMAFPADYVVGGNKRDKVKQYGNAVTPPVMDWIVRRCAASLYPELQDGAA